MTDKKKAPLNEGYNPTNKKGYQPGSGTGKEQAGYQPPTSQGDTNNPPPKKK